MHMVLVFVFGTMTRHNHSRTAHHVQATITLHSAQMTDMLRVHRQRHNGRRRRIAFQWLIRSV